MGGMVTIFDPQGNKGEVPFEHLQAAIKLGAKPSVTIKSPDGKVGDIPADRLPDAAKAGATVVPLEQQETQHPGFWAKAADLMGGLLHPSGFSPYPGMDQEAKSQAATQSAQLNESEKAAGYSGPYRALVPAARAVGVDVPGMEQSAKEGDMGGVAAGAVVPLATLTAAEGVAHGGPAAADAAKPYFDAVKRTVENVTPKQAAQVVGGTSGAVAGHGTLSAPGAYYGAKTAGHIVEGVLGKEIANRPMRSAPVNPGAPLPETPAPELLQAQPLTTGGAAPIPEPSAGLGQLPVQPVYPGATLPEHPGTFPGAPEPSLPPEQRLPEAFQPVKPKPPPVPGTVEAPFKSLMELPGQAVNQALQELGPKASIINVTERANKIANLLNEGLGGKGLEPNVPLRAQQGVVTPKLIEAQPQTIRYMRNMEGARNFGKYTEAVPGRYMIEDADWPNSKVPDERWEQGAVTFKKPLVMDAAQFGTDNWAKADWKQVLSQRYGGKTGQSLTNALRADGYDGIITKDKYGTGEIVDLNNKAQSAPEGHTPVDSSALKSYKYDPATKEFESVTTSGAHYIHGDVSPEQAAAFESAESKGKAWNDLRKNSTLVAKVVNGKRMAIRPSSELQSSDPNDLTLQLQKMLDDALAAKQSTR